MTVECLPLVQNTASPGSRDRQPGRIATPTRAFGQVLTTDNGGGSTAMSLPCKCSKDAKIQRWQGLSQIDAVMDGKRRGKTDSDYLYFLCPRCADNPLLQTLEYDIPREGPCGARSSASALGEVGLCDRPQTVGPEMRLYRFR